MNSAGKLTAAIQAITQFVDAAKSPPDLLALVTFAGVAGLNQPLTSDKAALRRALGSIITGDGTRIDLGLKVARQELFGARHRPDHGTVLILLSDGIQAPGEYGLVQPEAEAAKSAGAVIFTIALGTSADVDLLRRIASSPSHAYVAPTSADLSAVYGRIAVAIPCSPTGTPQWTPVTPPATPTPISTATPFPSEVVTPGNSTATPSPMLPTPPRETTATPGGLPTPIGGQGKAIYLPTTIRNFALISPRDTAWFRA